MRGGVSRVEILGVDGGDAVRMTVEGRPQGNAGLEDQSVRGRAYTSYPVRYLRRMIDQRLLRTFAACAGLSATVAAFGAKAQQPVSPAPQHRIHGDLVFDGVPPADPALAARLERYQQSPGAPFLDWSAARR